MTPPSADSSVPGPSKPAFTDAAALELARGHFGVGAAVRPLPSERDQNFLVTDDERGAWVLKISQAGEDERVLDMQNRAM
ncbi:MAG: phosphotransferase, partial [Planctomycetota bacterium]